ncbi:endonuclease/exonuclease/phosphatase family protein [Pseudonocardia sp. ICBG1293]|uniref:endonuclease/exonuclease/phosphatase family protein n=1 Tax=Pseudonocardia sp. ICBG1293 TaxID=2844382 RepID=UPI001CCFCC6B|nr:endonuclease/exonuclease/phosphatase family protein [Pseudonocardia sp. ICBG1293]
MRVASLNLASGRGPGGRYLAGAALGAAVAGVGADVVAVQEVDTGQSRSHGDDQPAVLAAGLGAVDWRAAATMAGEPRPDPLPSWSPVGPVVLRGPGDPAPGPRYGIALFSRVPVRRWHVLGLGAGRARLPVPVPADGGGTRIAWFPDEPRAAVAAELGTLTVVAAHLSFAPPTALRQLRLLRRWAAGLPGPVLVAGDLNLPGSVPALLTGGRRLVDGPTFPASAPRVQLDHLLALGGLTGTGPAVLRLGVGDHRAVAATVTSAG